jgi:hypothetical protein
MVWFLAGKGVFSSTNHWVWLWDSPTLLYIGYFGVCLGVEWLRCEVDNPPPVHRLRMGGALHPLTHIPLWHLWEQLYRNYTDILCIQLSPLPLHFDCVLFISIVVDFLNICVCSGRICFDCCIYLAYNVCSAKMSWIQCLCPTFNTHKYSSVSCGAIYYV